MLKETTAFTFAVALISAIGCSGSNHSGNGAAGGSNGSGATSSTGNGSIADYCDQSCEKNHDCDKTQDVKTCTNECKNLFAAVGPKLRTDFLDSITACVVDEDCLSVLDKDALDHCTEEAVAELAPSKAGTGFCDDYEAAADKCNGDFDKADCFNQAKTFNDDALADAGDCLEKACADIDDCVEAALGDVDGGGTGGTGGTGNTPAGGTGNTPAGGTGNTPAGGTGNDPGLSGACETGDPTECVNATTINACIGGEYTAQTCEDYFGEIGFASDTCTGTKCDLGDPLDDVCLTGANAYCACLGTCVDADLLTYYVACYTDVPAGTKAQLHCLADYVTGTQVDCDGGTACLE